VNAVAAVAANRQTAEAARRGVESFIATTSSRLAKVVKLRFVIRRKQHVPLFATRSRETNF
jgi:hypothetical protein